MSQNKQILNALKAGRELTPKDAEREFECMRLASRIRDLRELGHNIFTEIVRTKKGKRFARYKLV